MAKIAHLLSYSLVLYKFSLNKNYLHKPQNTEFKNNLIKQFKQFREGINNLEEGNNKHLGSMFKKNTKTHIIQDQKTKFNK